MPSSTLQALAQLRRVEELLRSLADPEDLIPRDAEAVARQLGLLEKLVTSSLVRYARRAGSDQTGLLAGATGVARGAAKRMLVAAERVEQVPVLHQALIAGELSLDQAALIAPAAQAAPRTTGALVEAARHSSFAELRKEAERTVRRARAEQDQVERERRVYARRYCRVRPADDGSVRVDALLTAVEGARLMTALEKETDRVFRASWSAGRHEPRERLCADALVRLVAGSAPAGGAHVVVRVDAGALVRGDVEDGEVCEIEGVGPVSVAAARSLLSDAYLSVLVKDGIDVRTVTTTSRAVPRSLQLALAERDQCCVVPGCGVTAHLEIDHWRLDFARHGPTELANLCRLCPTHHAMKSREGYRLTGGPGRWRWLPPAPAGRGAQPRWPIAAATT